MIIDNVKNLHRYSYVPNVQKAIDFLKSNDLNALEIGKYDLGDDCRVAVSEYDTKEIPEEVLLEAHREYIDLQMLISGEENFFFQAIDLGEEATEYNPTKDVEFYTASWYNALCLNSENFALIFPNDLHNGSFVVEDSQKVKKLVFKLKI